MYIVLSGQVTISVNTPDGKVLEIAEIEEGNFFGEMSIFDSSARSATCIPKCDTRVLSLTAADFYGFVKRSPRAGIRVMHRMLNITTQRLQKTSAFLSGMVTWGEQARTRAVTDDFTGLYNRRFLDEVMDDYFIQAETRREPLAVVMIDLDHFGTLNSEYGQQKGDEVILAVVPLFRTIFGDKGVLSRYGGDEFTFLLPQTTACKAEELCRRLVEEMGKIDLLANLGGSIKRISPSIGIACFPEHGSTVKEITGLADLALYKAKEQGRNRAVVWSN